MTTSLPRYVAETISVLPNADKLSDDSLGSLVSLVYNRGPSFKLLGDRYTEMRAIRLHMVNEEYDLIPAEIRRMAHLYTDNPDTAGLVTRRNLEAALFEKGLS
jgi:GH24 family phage-related lysozyme (muramidase)